MTNGEQNQSAIRSFKDLVAWQKAMTLAEGVYGATRALPKEETYGLTSQMRRAAVSIASNIAEGQARQTRGELLQFLGHARGSLAELETQTLLASRLHLLPSEAEHRLTDQIAETGRVLNGLRNSLKTDGKSSS